AKTPGLAATLHNLGLRYAELDRLEEALPPTRQAVALRRELAERNARHRPDLASSLSSLSSRLTDLGSTDQALAVIEEPVGVRRRPAAADPSTHSLGTARSLRLLSALLRVRGVPGEAVSAEREAETWESRAR